VTIAAVVVASSVVGGCAMTPTATARSVIEQRLLARSLERAVAQIDVSMFQGKRVFLDLAALTADQTYARTYVAAELRQQGVLIVGDASESEVRIQVIAPGLGVDQGETLIGVPATMVPLLGVPIPEVALFKWTRHRGMTELKFYAYDSKDGHPFEVAPTALGRSRYSQFTVLVILRFTRDDIDKSPSPSPTPPAVSPR
jgi:hypothetical protein